MDECGSAMFLRGRRDPFTKRARPRNQLFDDTASARRPRRGRWTTLMETLSATAQLAEGHASVRFGWVAKSPYFATWHQSPYAPLRSRKKRTRQSVAQEKMTTAGHARRSASGFVSPGAKRLCIAIARMQTAASAPFVQYFAQSVTHAWKTRPTAEAFMPTRAQRTHSYRRSDWRKGRGGG